MHGVDSPVTDSSLIDALVSRHSFGPAVTVERLETHCAWVLLTGDYAYKIKKPVDFGFLDYSTLEKRHFYCQEEVRLNRRFAPDIYLDVVAITGSLQQPVPGGDGPVLEYAVRMRQFPADGLLSQLAQKKRLDSGLVDQLVEQVSQFHRHAARATAGMPYGDPDHIHHWVSENFRHIRPALDEPGDIARLESLREWTEAERERLDPQLRHRQGNGSIRECHGDLHLGNITLIDGRVTLFDCIEFNPELRWIDVISEVAFLLMDLQDRGYANHAWRFLNGYLQHGGDYAGLAVLRYYRVYRALVRAKVALLRCQQAPPGSEAACAARTEYEQYLQLAEDTLSAGQPMLLITRGLSGSGKSTVARDLCEAAGLLQLRSDVERKRLAGLAATADSGSPTGAGLYAPQQTEKTYARLLELADTVLAAGYPVIVDATFLQRGQRDRFRALAQRRRVPFAILDCRAEDAELERRIRQRAEQGGDASEATLAVLAAQRESQQPLTPEECRSSVTVGTGKVNIDNILQALAGISGSVS